MQILLTGSSGWLGRFLAPRLRGAGHQVVGFDWAPGSETHVLGSVADPTDIDRAFGDHSIDLIVHTAALHKPDIARYPSQAFVDVNVSGTLNLLAAAVAHGHDRFIFTSTTSLMVTDAVRREQAGRAVWMDESFGPLGPRNIYGITKLTAEHLCRLYHSEFGLNCVALRTARFFPEEDDTLVDPSGPNLKANEFLNRRLTVEDAADAHLAAITRAPDIGYGAFVISAPTPFLRDDVIALGQDAPSLIMQHYPDAAELYARQGWQLPKSIGRVYDSSLAEAKLGFRCATDFGTILQALRTGAPMPFIHDPAYISPLLSGARA